MCQSRVERQESWYGEAEERDQSGPALVRVSGGTSGSLKGAVGQRPGEVGQGPPLEGFEYQVQRLGLYFLGSGLLREDS